MGSSPKKMGGRKRKGLLPGAPDPFPGCRKDPEYRRAYAAAYRAANRDLCIQRSIASRKKKPGEYRKRHRAWRSRNLLRERAKEAERRRRNPNTPATAKRSYEKRYGLILAKNAGRRAQKLRATPDWVDVYAVAAIYRLCREMNLRDGPKTWVVDHIVPLKHSAVCGLHIPDNLRIVHNAENCRKRNVLNDAWGVSPSAGTHGVKYASTMDLEYIARGPTHKEPRAASDRGTAAGPDSGHRCSAPSRYA